MKYLVCLHAVANPDHGEDFSIRPEYVPVSSIRAASETCRAWIVAHGYGGGNWHGSTLAGIVTDAVTGAVVATISYNGRADRWSSLISTPEGREDR